MMFSKKFFVLSFLFFQCWSVLLSASESESPVPLNSPTLSCSFDGIEGSVDSNGLSVTPVVCPTPEFDVPEENLVKPAVQSFSGKKSERRSFKVNLKPVTKIDFEGFDRYKIKEGTRDYSTSIAYQDCAHLVTWMLDKSVGLTEKYLGECNATICDIEQLLETSKIVEDSKHHDDNTNRRLRLNLLFACMTEKELNEIVAQREAFDQLLDLRPHQTVIDLVCQKVKNLYPQELLKEKILQQPEQCKKIKDEENFWAVGLEKQSKLLRTVSLKQASIKTALSQAEKDETKLRNKITKKYEEDTGKIAFPLQAWQNLQQKEERKTIEDAETQARAVQQIELLSELHSDKQYHSQFFGHRTAELKELKKRERKSYARILQNQKDKHELMQEQERDGLQEQEQSDRKPLEQSLFDQFLTVHYEQKEELGTLVYLRGLQNLKNTEQQKLQQIVTALDLKQLSKLEKTQTDLRTKIEDVHSFLLADFRLQAKKLQDESLKRQTAREQVEVARLKKESEDVRLAQESEENKARVALVEQQARSARYTSSIHKHQPYPGYQAPSDRVLQSHEPGFNVVVRTKRKI